MVPGTTPRCSGGRSSGCRSTTHRFRCSIVDGGACRWSSSAWGSARGCGVTTAWETLLGGRRSCTTAGSIRCPNVWAESHRTRGLWDTAEVLILVRHGRTPANAAGLLQGRLDQDLDDHGRAQAVAVAGLVRSWGDVDAVVSSPLNRARQTAAAFELPFETDERWLELSYGEYEGAPHTQVPSEVWQRWRDDAHFTPAGGESLAALDERVRAACVDLVERAADENVVVVSHVSPMKSAVA